MSARRDKRVKTRTEIRRLRKAAKITCEIFAGIRARIKPGRSEREIAREIDKSIKALGLKRSFRTIVASGPNAAHPHARPGGRKIRSDDMIVVDFGLKYRGYCSDMTRTVILGNPGKRLTRVYRNVKAAQRKAIKKAKAGIKISEFTGEVHGFLRKEGLGKYILHSLGHGVGRRIHEGPRLSEKNRRRLKAGMVVTLEPGLYLRGRGGARTEDMVLIRDYKCEVLTR